MCPRGFRRSRTHRISICVPILQHQARPTTMVGSPIICSDICRSESQCLGFNYRPSGQVCELFDQPGPTKLDVMKGCSYYAVCTSLSEYSIAGYNIQLSLIEPRGKDKFASMPTFCCITPEP